MKIIFSKKTKVALAAAVFTAGLMLGSLPASALTPSDYPVGASANGIANTRHNLGAYGRILFTSLGSTSTGDGTTEICVFCHTPHHAAGDAPLWNKGVQSTTYTAYGTTVAGTFIADGDIGGASLACLSCHDGVNAFDTLANAPGKGNGGANNTTATDFGWLFDMANTGNTSIKSDRFTPEDVANSHTTFGGMTFPKNTCNDCHDAVLNGGTYNASGGTGNPSNRLSIGTDLSNDHPISVPYQVNKASLRPTNTVISDILMTTEVFSAGDNDETDSTTTTANRWAVMGYINNTATIEDLLRGDGKKVECSSCHDPHFDNRSWDEVESTWKPTSWQANPSGASSPPASPYWCSDGDDCTDGNFLRRVGGNSVSGVCRTCHNK